MGSSNSTTAAADADAAADAATTSKAAAALKANQRREALEQHGTCVVPFHTVGSMVIQDEDAHTVAAANAAARVACCVSFSVGTLSYVVVSSASLWIIRQYVNIVVCLLVLGAQ